MAMFRQRLHAGRNKTTDVVEDPKVFDRVGLLFNEPPGKAELLFIQSSDDCELTLGEAASKSARTPPDGSLYREEPARQADRRLNKTGHSAASRQGHALRN
jgi:hypothetical protein